MTDGAAASGLYQNTTSSYEYYYDYDYDYNFTGSLPVPSNLPKCSSDHRELLCNVVSAKLKEVQELEKVDLTDGSESAWIWTSFSIFTPLCFLGIIGNILTIIVFAKFMKKITTTSVFIISLAVVDLAVCSTSMPIWLFTVLNGNHDSEVLCKLDKLLYFIAIPLSAFILLIISIDRFILIFLMKTNVMTALRAKVIVTITAVICLLLAIPQMLSFSTTVALPESLVKYRCKGQISCHTYKCTPTTQYIPQKVSYYLFQGLMIVYVLLAITFFVLYFLIFCKVYSLYKKMASWRGKHTFHEKADKGDLAHATFASDSNAETSTSSRLACDTPAPDRKNPEPPSSSYKSPQVSVIKKKKRKPPHLQTALTLFLVTFCFVLAYAPMILMMFLGSCSGKEDSSYTNICDRKDYRRFVWHFYFLNHITNPIIYSFMHPRFKEALKSFFHKCCSSIRC